jgi:hypothetical protein
MAWHRVAAGGGRQQGEDVDRDAARVFVMLTHSAAT